MMATSWLVVLIVVGLVLGALIGGALTVTIIYLATRKREEERNE